MSNISRRQFIKGITAGAAGLAMLHAPFASAEAIEEAAAKSLFIPGTYKSVQKTDFATIEVVCDISAQGVTDVKCNIIESSASDYFAMKTAEVEAYCARIAEAGTPVDVDGISGATLCTTAVKNGVNECLAQALGIDLTSAKSEAPANVINPQSYDYTNSYEDLSKSPLFSQWTLGPKTFDHRMVKSAAFQLAFLRRNPDEYINYYKRMADGGVQMIWIEDFADIWAETSGGPFKTTLDGYDVKGLVDTLHAAGATIGYQFDTMGAPIGPLDFSEPFLGNYDTDTIKRWIQEIIGIGVTLKENGFDAFELNFAANNLGQSFFSRARNNRTDEYGPQTIDSRCKFAMEVVSGLKEACGNDFIVQVLVNGVEENDRNTGNNDMYCTIEETQAIVKKMEEAGADSIHVRIGPQGEHIAQFAGDLYFAGRGFEGTNGYGQRMNFDKHFQGLVRGNNSGLGLNLDIAAKLKEVVSIPVGCATYNDPAMYPDLFCSAIEEGKVDFLVMNRPFCVDPQYVNKLRENRIDEIAPCTRCLHCFYDTPADGCNLEHCRVNAANFRAYSEVMPEGFEPLPAEIAKKVMVIGAGPAGMEAARIAAQRGHDVTIYDKAASLGGLLSFAEAVKGPHENLGRLRDYLARQLEVSGVKVVLNTEVTAELIATEAPDAVILAAGGKRDTLGLVSTASTNVISVDDVLGGSVGDKVVVLGSNAQAVDTAIYLLSLGKDVSIVTPSSRDEFEKGHSVNVQEFIRPTYFGNGGRLFPMAQVIGVEDGCIRFVCESGVEIAQACDTVVEALDMLPNTDLIADLGEMAVAVGDCQMPLNIANCIATGNVAARAL